ncbi:uncharacterized protein LOC133321380 [Musca vetustissima]|uniref:uncharacterized protein LOC133321380 n=1 Tax=Musca vetustissima TaxID=27455 RepID=UPI002AB680C1|nr:uncharacterized protein LOC133321380 [Musca vetustissima]
MSRFSLRSASENLRLLDEKPNRRKTCNPVSISMKRNSLAKDIKHVTNIKEENIIDDIKIEIDDADKVSSEATDTPQKDKTINDGDDDDADDDDNEESPPSATDNSDLSFRQYISTSSSLQASLICSLPLERIHDVLQKLNLTNHSKHHINSKDVDEVDESLDNDDDEEDDNNISKQSTSSVKNLCLYCDKKFSSQKMQVKHVEKFHCLQQDRRCSGRNSQMQQTQTPKKRKNTTGSQNFTGCSYCPKNKGQPQSVILPASELNALFLHLADCHSDRYFGCKTCVLRFQNISKLSKHMEVVHKSLSFAFDESSSKSKDNDTDSQMLSDKSMIGERSKLSLRRQQRSQKSGSAGAGNSVNSSNFVQSTVQCTTTIVSNSSIIGAEEPILSRLGLTQNRLPNNRKGVRLRREKLISEMLLKSEQNSQPSTNYTNTVTTSSTALNSATCSPKLRGKAIKAVSGFSGDTTSDVIFRVPTRNDILSCVFDDNFYKEVVSNVRNNLLFHLDGKIMGNSMESPDSAVMRHTIQPQIRSTLVKSPIVITTDSEIHAATSLAAITAFPTLLTAEQFGGDGHSSKIRRPHTKNSWKWKWDSVKKFKFVNEGGKIVKKMKHPMLGLRDLSKLDMWTQLTMRQKHEQQTTQNATQSHNAADTWNVSEIPSDPSREEKQRLNDQLNMILDMRLLPHIILEQNEQAIIKLENDEFGIAPSQLLNEDCGDNFMEQTFADESFLSMLNLLPNSDSRKCRSRLVLSGEWARPRCYLCMCCGAKFEKLKSLEEHKMFRHSQILSTHYEVVGRELLNGNLLRHLFLPKKALSRYANDMGSNQIYSGAARRLFWHKNETICREITNNEESSDSLQSMLNSCTTNSLSIKNSSSTEDCDVVDTKMATVASLGLMATTAVVSPTHSIQSCSSSSSSVIKSKTQSRTGGSIYGGNGCSKCGRKCNGILDLYRHMLDCSGDYVWSLAKKRKYRYYCGSKKRRPCNKHSILELRKAKSAAKPAAVKSPPTTTNEGTEDAAPNTSSNFTTKSKTSPRPRPSDAESIKKMLENLPPKRVCKKIFPTINKTKKTMKNIKPKILAKHKIYNKLRNTRVRQMTQAAKILSKTKTQLQKSKRMTTRSATTPPLTMTTNKNAKVNANKKRAVTKPVADKSSVTKSKPAEEKSSISDDVDQSGLTISNKIKLEDQIDSSMTTVTVVEKHVTNTENSKNAITCTRRVVFEPDGTNQNELSNTNTYKPNDVDQVDAAAASASSLLENLIVEGKKDSIPNDRLGNVNKQADVVNPIQINTVTETERQVANNKNVKRSKRISDCIAMLTGKLEQKLKTEQKASVPPVNSRSTINTVTEQPPIENVAVIPTMPAPQVSQQNEELLKSVSQSADELDTDKNNTTKKTPKRKTISRRIIKADDGTSPTKSTEQNIEGSCNLPKSTDKTINVSSVVKDKPAAVTAASVKLNINEQQKPTRIVAKTAPTPDVCMFNTMDNKQAKSIPTAALIGPPLPAVMPLNNQHLMPQVPMFIPVENLCAPHLPAALPSLPLPLPLPVPAPAPTLQPAPIPPPVEKPVQPPTVIHAVPPPTAIGIIPPPAAIPLITSVPPAHLPVATEPLNLSSSAKNTQKQSQDLSFSSRQKIGGMPARRQTICGFEARNFIMYDEMEPLDLSNKARPEKASPSPIVQVQTLSHPQLPNVLPSKPTEITPILLPTQHPSVPLPPSSTMPTSVDPSLLPVPPITPDALLNKHFYSNLDLLRIPQVRNPVAGQGAGVSETPPLPLPLTQQQQAPMQPPTTILTPQPSLVVNPVPIPVAVPKVASKKRNKSSVAIQNNVHVECNQTINNIVAKPTVSSKDSIIITTKKDTSSKNKGPLRMDEEVINHIDDAINSVINAVKASLDNEEAERSKAVFISTQPQPAPPSLKTTDDVNVTKESVGEFKYLTAARRNMRSKTLDCRPAALNRVHVQNTPPLTTNNTQQTVDAKAKTSHQQTISVRNIETLMVPVADVNNITTYASSTLVPCSSTNSMTTTDVVLCTETEKNDTTMHVNNIPKVLESQFVAHSTEERPAQVVTEVPKAIPETSLHFEEISAKAPPVISQPEDSAERIKTGETKSGGLAALSDISAHRSVLPTTTVTSAVATTATTTTPSITSTNLDLEQMSNNNNTSSGFHSSAQSDQQTSVMSTTTTVSTSIPVADPKKKQRRRRKNELAAIVADQLLESFKLDKARRDNLKKLENLAYEKSEDLLLTGMLLMSSTKRNVTSSAPTINNSMTPTSGPSSAADNNESISKRNNKQQQNADTSKMNDTIHGIDNVGEQYPTTNNDSKITLTESTDTGDNKKNSKRRQCRRRGKTLDNENISKLKSSLESFSIDIERQLTEYEAKNSQLNAKSQTALNSKSTVILRPSILSMTLEASTTHQENQQLPVKTSAPTADTNKTVVSSRDPRLNKNIHKEGEKSSTLGDGNGTRPLAPAQKSPEVIGDVDEDNYLTEIAKNVNEKIMSTENEEFAFKDDGFEMANDMDMGMDDSNSKYSRPPTSMSVRSAPNFNDDRSNFGSICDENTNTEVMDMDLDDEMSVYTSYSQDLGRGRGRRRRRRRSILLTRKPKKRASSRDMSAEKIECILCKKVFYSANSLTKHNMTLAHVSKVSEQEYLLSKSITNSSLNIDQNQKHGTLGPYARRSTRRATISEPPMHMHSNSMDDLRPTLPLTTAPIQTAPITQPPQLPQADQISFKQHAANHEMESAKHDEPPAPAQMPQQQHHQPPDYNIDASKAINPPSSLRDGPDNDYDGNNANMVNPPFNGNSRLNLNPDERLFFECCNILKSAETPRLNNVIVPEVVQECNNINATYNAYPLRHQEKSLPATLNNSDCLRDRSNLPNVNMDITERSGIQHSIPNSNVVQSNVQQPPMEHNTIFRDPPQNVTNNYNNRSIQENRNVRSPTYSAISHLSAVTNTTSRFKTKAAMKGYENVNMDLIQQQESKSRTICKLTELAEIALGNEDKPSTHSFSPIQSSNTPTRPSAQNAPCATKPDLTAVEGATRVKSVPAPDYATMLATENNPKESNVPLVSRTERTKNNETRSSTSSKTIMHSSIIKAAVEEHQKTPTCSKIIIPDRPFKNIGLEEKETITFQKPKTPAVHLLTEDNNSVSTGSFSDRDDYDFGSLSCDEEASVRESNEKNPRNNSTDSSSESSRATAKTFENKSLIMGRIFKNVSTKAAVKTNVTPAVKVKSVGVQKDQAPTPKADLNQLFDELRGNSGVEQHLNERGAANSGAIDRASTTLASSRTNHKQHQPSPPAVVSSTTATPATTVRKTKARESRAKPKAAAKTSKDISKLQTELGMSPDEIKKLIDEGQRKSKRRCATNRPKKLVEMWSSDEYEEFLSTKDIIALIEEKEQQEEKRKKRKNSINMSSNNSEMAKEKDTPDVTSSTKEPKRKNSRKVNANIDIPIPEVLAVVEAKSSKTKKSGKEDAVSTTGFTLPDINTAGSTNNVKEKRSPAKGKSKAKQSTAKTVKTPKSKKESKSKVSKKPIDDDDNYEDEDDIDNSDFGDDDYIIADLIKKKKANVKAKSSKAAKIAAPTVTSTANVKLSKTPAAPTAQSTRKRNSLNSVNVSPTDTPKSQKQTASATSKTKRKNQTNQSPPRRKRPATEKLYYWSSSSDEEFGRISNTTKGNPVAENSEGGGGVGGGVGVVAAAAASSGAGGGEQYQKHGWIVGDSHKKLVTLLAIAKGNKKVDSNSGVKKNVTKKRN